MMEAVIFDCDGVLVDSEIIVIEEKINALKNLGISYSFQDFIFLYLGLSEDDFYRKVATRYPTIFSKEDLNKFRLFLNNKLIERLDQDISEIPGIRNFVESIKSKKGIASNGNALGVEKKLKKADLYKQFYPYIYSGDMVLRKKPDPDIYLLAAQNLSVRPDRCIVIEDTPNGIRAAYAAGMLPVGLMIGSHAKYMNPSNLKEAGAEYVFDTLERLDEFLCKSMC